MTPTTNKDKIRINSVQKRNYYVLHYMKTIKVGYMIKRSRHKMMSISVKNDYWFHHFPYHHHSNYLLNLYFQSKNPIHHFLTVIIYLKLSVHYNSDFLLPSSKSCISMKTLAKLVLFFDKLVTFKFRSQKIKRFGRLKWALGQFFCRRFLRTPHGGEGLKYPIGNFFQNMNQQPFY